MKIVIYSRQLCPYCDKAKELLKSKGFEYEEIDCSFSTEKTKEMMVRSGRETYPQIFFDSTHIGGFDDLSALNDVGALENPEALLSSVGAGQ